MMKILNRFDKVLIFGVFGALIFLGIVELGLLNLTGLPSLTNVSSDLIIGFIASASTAIVFKYTNNVL